METKEKVTIFQFLLVRLREKRIKIFIKEISISIPSGAIKRDF